MVGGDHLVGEEDDGWSLRMILWNVSDVAINGVNGRAKSVWSWACM